MKVLLNQVLIALYSCYLLVGCATAEEDNELGRDINYSASDCISIRTIRDYTPLDRSTLLIDGGGKRSYLVRLVHSSFELQSAHGIGFSSHDGFLCPYGGDEIVVESMSRERLRIRSISRLDEQQVEDVLIRYGKIETDSEQDPVPAEEVEGAEVEELG
ncbi:MAG: hypothetical protein ACI88G_000579 [Woeseiaceae bacterium]|jgi:hypothetical protein